MRISEFEVEQRQKLFSLSNDDIDALQSAQAIIDANIDTLVSDFYSLQTSIPEISLLIGDSDTLTRLSRAQRRYVIDLFSGIYDLEYVNNRLRIGMVHKRIGVEPKLYLSAIYTLKNLLIKLLKERNFRRHRMPENTDCSGKNSALRRNTGIRYLYPQLGHRTGNIESQVRTVCERYGRKSTRKNLAARTPFKNRSSYRAAECSSFTIGSHIHIKGCAKTL